MCHPSSARQNSQIQLYILFFIYMVELPVSPYFKHVDNKEEKA